MITLLVWLIVLCIFMYIAWLVVRAFPIPSPFGNIILAIVCLIALLLFVDQVGLLRGPLLR